MSRLIAFNKPYGVVCQFSADGKHPTLKDFIDIPSVYPAGRLDTDSEGLLLLTDDGALQSRIADPRHKLDKEYWVQVEGIAEPGALQRLQAGMDLGDFVAGPAHAEAIAEPPGLWERVPPVRFRKTVPTSWIRVVICEGKNRQVRRMTAAAGLPTLRLVRARIGPWRLGNLLPGSWREEAIPAGPGRIAERWKKSQ
jgi:23S rRNA pseudouridine2457 synthase